MKLFGIPVTIADYMFARGTLRRLEKKFAEVSAQAKLLLSEVSIVRRAVAMDMLPENDPVVVGAENAFWASQGELSVLRMDISSAKFTVASFKSGRLREVAA